MKKKIIILLFILCIMPCFAQDSVSGGDEIRADIVGSNFQPLKEEKKAKKFFNFNFLKKTKNLFKRKKTVENVEKAKKAVKVENVEKVEQKEVPVVNTSTDNTVLTNTAYQGSIQTNRIMDVDECVKIAMEKHPLIQSALADTEIYKSRIAQAWSNYFPTFSAGLSYSRNDMHITTMQIPVQRYNLFYVPTVSANMLLFDFGKTKSQADIAKRTYEASKFGLENAINTVVYNVKQSYYNLLFAQQQVKVYEETVHDYEMHLEQAQAYYNIGKKPKIDVMTAEYNLGKAKLNLIQANNTLKIAYVELSNAMGMPEFSDYDVKDNLPDKTYDISMEKAVETAYETSPELLAAKKKKDASEILVKASKRAFLPDLSAFASYSKGGKKIDTDDGYQFGAQLSYQTVNLLLLKKQVDEAKATFNKDFADYQNTKQNIYYEVKQAYLNLVTAQEGINVSKLSMEQAKEQYDLAAGRYKVGMGEAIELKDAETTYRNAQLDYYNTLLNYQVSAANLERLMGVPLKKTDIELL